MTLNPFKLYKQIAAIFKLKGMVTNMKISELSTSSGRAMIVLNLVTIYSALNGILPPVLVAKIGAISVMVYTLYRAIVPGLEAIVRMTSTPKDDAVLAEIKALIDSVATKIETK